MKAESPSEWNTFSRVNASQRWRQPSAAMGRHMTEAIVAEAQVQPGMRLLDVACGTGEPAISFASLLQQSGSVVATDISSGPLEIGRERALKRGLGNIEFLPADVHQLPFPDAGFDRVTSRLGVMFFADLPRALREIRRVLKPGGRASLLAWGTMEQPYFTTTVGTILRLCPTITVPASAAGMFRFGKPNALDNAFWEAGFAQVEERQQEVPWNWPGTPEELWTYFQEVTVPFKPVLEAVPVERRHEVHAQVLAKLRERYDGREVAFLASIVLVSATP
jgi:SAM-dependent methyltransferase